MIQHYEGRLGIFNYDDEEFELLDGKSSGEWFSTYLHYIGKGLSVDLPKGCIDTRYMFDGCTLPQGFTLGGEFNTSDVIYMPGMFRNCIISNGFSLGNNFDTSNVKDMAWMFEGCYLPDDFCLGDKFDTRSVLDTQHMFYDCRLPKGVDIDKSAGEIISILKRPLKPSAPASESGSEVWKILNKEKYTEEFIPQAEKMYGFIKKLVDTCGNTTVDGKTVPTMRVFFNMWNEYSHETFRILDALVRESDTSTTEMDLF